MLSLLNFSAGSSVQFPGSLDSVGAWSAAIEGRIFEEEQGQQEMEDSVEDEREHIASSQHLVNLTGAGINFKNIAYNEPAEDEPQPPLEQTEIAEEDVLNLPIANLRWALMNHLLKPILEMQELQKNTVSFPGHVSFKTLTLLAGRNRWETDVQVPRLRI